jgi:type VI secretion system Hcp family effector
MERGYFKRTSLSGLTALLISFVSCVADAGVYIKFAEIDGESHYGPRSHPWSDASAFSHEVKVDGKPAGRRGASVIPEPILITKPVDRITPYLLESTVTQKVFKHLTIHVTEPRGKEEILLYSVKLDNVRILSHKVLGKKSPKSRPIEEIRLVFGAMKVEYVSVDTAGRSKGKFEYHWRNVIGK